MRHRHPDPPRSARKLPRFPAATVAALWAVSSAALVGSLGGCASLGRPSASRAVDWAAQRLPLSRCTLPDHEELLCGTYQVYEDRQEASGRQIEMFVVVAPAFARNPKPDPVFFFEGGPGGSATRGVDQIDEFPLARKIRRNRDLVFIDQRGTGRSHGLDCETGGSPENPQGYFEPVLNRELVVACREELEKKADLALYTTSIAMDDIEEVRQWLGYGPINLWGGSYGTRAIQVFLRRHPESARTALLEGVAGMKQHLPLFHARDGKRGADLLFASCAADSQCRAAFPNVAEEFRQVLARLADEPAEAELSTPSGKQVTVRIGPDLFAEVSRFITYSPQTAIYLPLLVHMANEGDFRPFIAIGRLWRQSLQDIMSYGLWMSVTCAEDLPFFGPEETRRETAGTYLGDFRIRMQKMACEEWPRGEIPAGYHDAVTADVPTLMISGLLDPVTPPSWAEEVHRHLPRSRHVVVPHGHHGSGGLAHQECLDELILDFLDSGSLDGLDASCVTTMSRPPFATDPAEVEQFVAAANE